MIGYRCRCIVDLASCMLRERHRLQNCSNGGPPTTFHYRFMSLGQTWFYTIATVFQLYYDSDIMYNNENEKARTYTFPDSLRICPIKWTSGTNSNVLLCNIAAIWGTTIRYNCMDSFKQSLRRHCRISADLPEIVSRGYNL